MMAELLTLPDGSSIALTQSLSSLPNWIERNIDIHATGVSDEREVAKQFLNRITEVIRFNNLGKQELPSVLDQILEDKGKRLRAVKEISLQIDSAIKSNPSSTHVRSGDGGRSLERQVDRLIFQPLS